MSGKVTLVGAGTGDVGLITIKGFNALKASDVVVYDRLVGDDILKLIPENAEKINVGKCSGNHNVPQEDINKILLQKAQQGKNVVRLKGGDNFLFGRGGEELELLYENNVEFEVIPGITSAIAVPSYAGIPVTHRDFASSVHIITGHQKKNEPLKINFKSCVECGGTLVFLMSLANLESITKGLIENGMDKNMPCAVIENGTRVNQRKIIGTVSDIYEKCSCEKIKSPSIIVIGEVCSLSDKFDWFNKLPLKGIKVASTRPKDRAVTLSDKLKAMGAEVFEYPCIETKSILNDEKIKQMLEKIKAFEWIVFTSPAGVNYVFQTLLENGKDSRIFGKNKFAVIGSATKKELLKYGIKADLMPDIYSGIELGKALVKEKANNILLLRAENGGRTIIDIFENYNINYFDFHTYKTIFENDCADLQEKINNGEIDYVTFTSASTVKAFCNCIKSGYDNFKGVCIGEMTANEAKKSGINTIISKKAEIDSIIEAIKEDIN